MREENRSETIHEALNLLEDDFILEADEIRGKAESTTQTPSFILKNWRRWTTLAASICVVALVGVVWNEIIIPNEGYDTVEEAAMENDTVSQQSIAENNERGDLGGNEVSEEAESFQTDLYTDKITNAESQMLKESQEQIHLPNQRVEDAAGVESLAKVEIPAYEFSLEKPKGNVEMDMLAFFIYEGRCYVQSEYYKDGRSVVGDYVGTSIGMIDEWTKEDGYVDYAGSIAGKFYEVKGYDPSFMLCMKFEDGAIETFINNNGITLGKGSDLIEDRLHLKNNFEKVTFKTQKEWGEGLQVNHVLPEEYNELSNQFLESFSSDDFMYIKDTPLDVNGTGRYHENKDNYYLTFHTKDGLQFDFVLYENGYVSFQAFHSVCVQIDPALYEEMIGTLKNVYEND